MRSSAAASASFRWIGSTSRNGTVAIAASCSSGTTAPASIELERPAHDEREHRQDRAGDGERPARAGEVEEERREHRADAEPADRRRLDEAEDAARDGGGRRSLDQRHRRDVDDAVPDPEQRERDDRRPRPRQRREREQRRAEAREPEPEVRRRAPAPDERERDERADDRADAGRRLQEPDAGVAEVEQLERDDDDEHAVRAGDDRLRAVEPDHDAQARLASHGAEAGGDARRRPRARAPPARGRSVFGMRATNDALQR